MVRLGQPFLEIQGAQLDRDAHLRSLSHPQSTFRVVKRVRSVSCGSHRQRHEGGVQDLG
jgi:hypothetical protein